LGIRHGSNGISRYKRSVFPGKAPVNIHQNPGNCFPFTLHKKRGSLNCRLPLFLCSQLIKLDNFSEALKPLRNFRLVLNFSQIASFGSFLHLFVGEDGNFYASVCSTARIGIVVRHRLGFSIAFYDQALCAYALCNQIACNRVCTAFRERLVIFVGAYRIRVSFYENVRILLLVEDLRKVCQVTPCSIFEVIFPRIKQQAGIKSQQDSFPYPFYFDSFQVFLDLLCLLIHLPAN